ncbi:MAG TPA: hypothetical protein PKD37_07540 [Oligoflexia bacterium]|nr:hypothetical protein [Oligoflexia bacterium]
MGPKLTDTNLGATGSLLSSSQQIRLPQATQEAILAEGALKPDRLTSAVALVADLAAQIGKIAAIGVFVQAIIKLVKKLFNDKG